MSVAAIGGAVIGVAGSIYASNKASKSAKKAGKQASEAEQARLDFEKQRYDEWQATYGPLEDRLAAYYESLTPTMRITQGLESYEKEKTRVMDQLNQSLEQRGGGLGGMTEQTEGQFAIASAEERARIRAEAPMEVAKEQAGFLQIGLNQNPDEGMRNALDSSTRRAQNIEDVTARNAGIAQGAVIDSVTNLAQAGLDKYAAYRAANPSVGEV